MLALGFRVWGAWSPYRLLWELPGWRGIRTPGRLFTFTSLALAVLAGAGAQRVIAAVGPGLRRMALTGALAGAVLLEGFGPVPHQFAPPPPAGFAAACAPLYVLPSDARFDNTSEFWSIDGFPQMVNGFSGFPPASLVALRTATRRFPDRRSVALLRGRGVRTVVLDLARAARTPWSRADSRPTTGLGVTRVPAGGVVLYRLGGC